MMKRQCVQALLMGTAFVFACISEAFGSEGRMVKIPAGSFIMGGEYNEVLENDYDIPKHKVHLDSFLMDKFEVTQGDFEKLMGANPLASEENMEIMRRLREDKTFKPIWPVTPVEPDYPVADVTWYDAARYCNARSKAEGLEPCYDEETWECDFSKNGYRLPTEAEWEYACRAGSQTRYFFGDDWDDLIKYANIWPDTGEWHRAFYKNGYFNPEGVVWDKPVAMLLPVGSKKPNKWGLYDTLGNVKEWCNDWFDENYYKESPEKNPRGPATGESKIIRGRDFRDGGAECGSRNCNKPRVRSLTGFRCVRNAPKDEKAEEKPVEPKRDDKEEKKE